MSIYIIYVSIDDPLIWSDPLLAGSFKKLMAVQLARNWRIEDDNEAAAADDHAAHNGASGGDETGVALRPLWP